MVNINMSTEELGEKIIKMVFDNCNVIEYEFEKSSDCYTIEFKFDKIRIDLTIINDNYYALDLVHFTNNKFINIIDDNQMSTFDSIFTCDERIDRLIDLVNKSIIIINTFNDLKKIKTK